MLEGEYKGGLFEGLNQIIKLSEELENEEPIGLDEQVPYGVELEYCDACDNIECCCEPEADVSQGGAAGSQLGQGAILGSENSDEVGEISTQQLVEECMVKQVQSIIKSNIEKAGKGNYDPLGFFKEPIKVDLYEPEIKYGEDMIK